MNNIIGVAGFHATGSTAYIDFLKEFNENQVIDQFEFVISHVPDGLEDLRYHLNEGSSKYISSVVAIERFEKICKNIIANEFIFKGKTKKEFIKISNKYIKDITQASWIGKGMASTITEPKKKFFYKLFYRLKLFRLISYLENKFKKELKVYPLQKYNYSANPENFIEISQKYINDILDLIGVKKEKKIVLDQPFAGNNPQASFDFFNNPLAIVVNRDPRDYYIFARELLYKKGIRMIPVNSVENFVKYYRKMRENMPYQIPNNKILVVNFEDLVYDYEKTKEKVMVFCGLEEHSNPKTYFKPNDSINNTQLYSKYIMYNKEIEYIEQNLKEYLYPFEKYKNVVSGSKEKMFHK